LALGWGAIYASRTCLFPLYPVIAADLGISFARVGFLSGFYFMIYVLFQIPAGLVMDRLGTKRCLMAGCVFSSLALIGTAFFGNSYGELLFLFGVQGLSDSFYYSGAQGTIVTHTPPEHKAIASAMLGAGMSIGILAGLGLSHVLYAALEGYRPLFLLLGILRFALAGLILRFVPDVPSAPVRFGIRDYFPMFRDAYIWRIGGVIFCLMYGFWVMLNWGPTFLGMERGFVAEHAGFYSGLVALASIPGGLAWGSLSNRIGPKAVIITAMPLSGVFLFAVAGVGASYSFIVLSLLAFGLCTNSAIVPVSVVWISRISEARYPGKTVGVIAFFNCVIVSSAIVAPVLSGFIRDLSDSLSGAIYLAAASALISPLLLRGIGRERDSGV
jgi:MFS family permease